MTDAAAGVHRRAWERGDVAGDGAGRMTRVVGPVADEDATLLGFFHSAAVQSSRVRGL